MSVNEKKSTKSILSDHPIMNEMNLITDLNEVFSGKLNKTGNSSINNQSLKPNKSYLSTNHDHVYENSQHIITKDDAMTLKINRDLDKVKHEFYKYMIEQKSNFTELDKIEDSYKLQIKRDLDKLNKNALEIEKKKEYIKRLDKISGNIIADTTVLNKNDIINHFEAKIKELELNIALQSINNENYNEIKSKVSMENFWANERFNFQTDEMKEINRQYEAYKIIQLNSSIQNKFQKKLHDTVNRHQFENEFKYQKDLEQKSKAYNMLDFQVNAIQNETATMTKKLEKIQEEQTKLLEIISLVDFRNNNMLNENIFIENNFNHDNKLINDLHVNLEVSSVDEIINKFKTESLKYDTCYNEFERYNITIMNLNEIYTGHFNELELIKKKMKIKREIEEMESFNDLEANIAKELKELRGTLVTVARVLAEKGKLFKKVSMMLKNKLKMLFTIMISYNVRGFLVDENFLDIYRTLKFENLQDIEPRKIMKILMFFQKMIAFSYYNKLSSVVIISLEEDLEDPLIESLKKTKIINIENDSEVFELERLSDEKINNINREKRNYMERSNFEIFSGSNFEDKKEEKEDYTIRAKLTTRNDILNNFLDHFGAANLEGGINPKIKTNLNQLINRHGNSFVNKSMPTFSTNNKKNQKHSSVEPSVGVFTLDKNHEIISNLKSRESLLKMKKAYNPNKNKVKLNTHATEEAVDLDNSYDSKTKLGIYIHAAMNKKKKETKRYIISEDPNMKRKGDIDKILFNLFYRKDNTQEKEKLNDFASYFSKKHKVKLIQSSTSVEKEKELLYEKDKILKKKLNKRQNSINELSTLYRNSLYQSASEKNTLDHQNNSNSSERGVVQGSNVSLVQLEGNVDAPDGNQISSDNHIGANRQNSNVKRVKIKQETQKSKLNDKEILKKLTEMSNKNLHLHLNKKFSVLIGANTNRSGERQGSLFNRGNNNSQSDIEVDDPYFENNELDKYEKPSEKGKNVNLELKSVVDKILPDLYGKTAKSGGFFKTKSSFFATNPAGFGNAKEVFDVDNDKHKQTKTKKEKQLKRNNSVEVQRPKIKTSENNLRNKKSSDKDIQFASVLQNSQMTNGQSKEKKFTNTFNKKLTLDNKYLTKDTFFSNGSISNGSGGSKGGMLASTPSTLPTVFNMNNFNKLGGLSMAKYLLKNPDN